jgi:hypothetical protein
MTKITILPIEVEELTENDLKSGMTSDASAEIFLSNGEIINVPKSGTSITLSTTIKILRAHLRMYDRQGPDFFTVMPQSSQGDQDHITLRFVQRGPVIVFNLIETL